MARKLAFLFCSIIAFYYGLNVHGLDNGLALTPPSESYGKGLSFLVYSNEIERSISQLHHALGVNIPDLERLLS